MQKELFPDGLIGGGAQKGATKRAKPVVGSFRELDDLRKSLSEQEMLLVQDKLVNPKTFSDAVEAGLRLDKIQKRESGGFKSYIVDPLTASTYGYDGYFDVRGNIDFEQLRQISEIPLINMIIKKRQDQMAAFCNRQDSSDKIGFQVYRESGAPQDYDNILIDRISNWIENCGFGESWEGDNMDGTMRKLIADSLIYDQCGLEITRRFQRNGVEVPFECRSVDAKELRIASTYDDDAQKKYAPNRFGTFPIKGYYPSYVMLRADDNQIYAHYYPWELWYGIRNPSSDSKLLGYGSPELFVLIPTLTNLLNAELYNASFFKNGSFPATMILVKGATQAELNRAKEHWNNTLRGPQNAHRVHWEGFDTEGEIEIKQLMINNKDMDFQGWIDHEMQYVFGVMRMDPLELGYKFNATGTNISFESQNANRLYYSQEHGLRPIVKMVKAMYTKYIVKQIHPSFAFRFTGLDSMTREQELALLISKVQNISTVNEVRKEIGLDEIEGGDIILNAAFLQATRGVGVEEGGEGGGSASYQGFASSMAQQLIDQHIEKSFNDSK